MADLLFLDPNKHPYIVLTRKGTQIGRFSNVACAAMSVVKRAWGGTVLLPDGTTLDKVECSRILESWKTVREFAKRPPTGMVA